jgi:hypothetical protein
MSDLTPVLGLVRQYLQDHGDKRVDNINWDKLDRLFHPIDGHKHDGVDSPLIDLEALWRAIYELRRLVAQLRIDLTNLDIREWQHYEEYIKHKHYALDAPPSIETHWFDTFNNYLQTDLALTNASVSAGIGALHLPLGYTPRSPYYFVSKPFRLAHTMVENPNPDIQPDQAYARIIQQREGIVTPYIAIGDNLIPSSTDPRRYPGARVGNQLEISYIDNYTKRKMTFEGKVRENISVPHIAWHYYDIKIPEIKVEEKRPAPWLSIHSHIGQSWTNLEISQGCISAAAHAQNPFAVAHAELAIGNCVERQYKIDYRNYTDRLEFQTNEYARLSISDNNVVSTGDGYSGASPVFEETPYSQDYRVLYNADKALAWQKSGNKFFWYDSETKTATEIPRAQIEPLYEENMINVAAAPDPNHGFIYVLKSWIQQVISPNGYFDLYHQLVRWDGVNGFVEGRVWRSSRHKRRHWPATVICPTWLKIDNNNIYPICSFDFNDLKDEGESLVNYYDGDDRNPDAHDDYMWFPFKKVYGDLHKQRGHVTFAYFNPGILGTIHTIPKTGEWVATGSANVIRGAYDPTANEWSTHSEEDINEFEGGNDCHFLGTSGQEIFFYQSFTPYDGYDILRNKRYQDRVWREAHPDYSWHGIIAYNISTGRNRHIRGNMPMRINVGGSVNNTGGDAYLVGGMELVKQFYTSDGRIIATVDNVTPTGTTIVYAFWADRNDPECVVPDRVSLRDEINNPLKIDLSFGYYARVQTSTASITASASVDYNIRRHGSQVIWHSTGFSQIGGWNISARLTFRVRYGDRKIRVCKRWHMGLLDGGRPRQIYNFDLGEDIELGDTFRLYLKTRSEGKLSSVVSTAPTEDVVVYGLRDKDWVRIGGVTNNQGLVTFEIQDLTFSALGEITIMLESARVSDKASRQAAFLHTDHIYVAITKQNYVYEYEWEDLPDGQNAVIILECTGGMDAAGNEELGSADATGVWVDSAEFSIIANREG